MKRAVSRCAIAVLVSAVIMGLVSGCGWKGLNSIPLPGTKGGGPGSYLIQVQMPDVVNIQQNARVRVADVNVGTVTEIERQGWHALLTLRLDGDVHLPANATAKIGQTSLLGSTHIELAPPTNVPAEGRLHEGSLIPLANAGAYPTTEQTLSAVSLLLNSGGVGQIQDVVQTFSTALRGREQDLRSLLVQLDTFVANIDGQTADIISATDSLNRVVGKFAAQKPVLDKALTTIPNALVVLKQERSNLADALVKIGQFSAIAGDSVKQTKENLVKELRELSPVIKSLADAGPAMTRSFSSLLTYPFPNETLDNWFRGDYGNLSAIIDLTLSRIDSSYFVGTRFEGDLTQLEMQWGRTIGQLPSPYTSANPLVAPYHLDQGP